MFTSGKHNGKSFEDVLKNDLAYCKKYFNYKNPTAFNENMQEFITFVNKNYKEQIDKNNMTSMVSFSFLLIKNKQFCNLINQIKHEQVNYDFDFCDLNTHLKQIPKNNLIIGKYINILFEYTFCLKTKREFVHHQCNNYILYNSSYSAKYIDDDQINKIKSNNLFNIKEQCSDFIDDYERVKQFIVKQTKLIILNSYDKLINFEANENDLFNIMLTECFWDKVSMPFTLFNYLLLNDINLNLLNNSNFVNFVSNTINNAGGNIFYNLSSTNVDNSHFSPFYYFKYLINDELIIPCPDHFFEPSKIESFVELILAACFHYKMTGIKIKRITGLHEIKTHCGFSIDLEESDKYDEILKLIDDSYIFV